MNKYFECKVRRSDMNANGKIKKLTETYLVDAMSFTEAESRMVEEMTVYYSMEFSVSGIRMAGYQEVLQSDLASDDRWYVCKVRVEVIGKDDSSSYRTQSWLVQADGVRRVLERADEFMRGSMADYEVLSVSLSAVKEVLEYEGERTEKRPVSNLEQVLSSMAPGSTASISVGGKDVMLRRVDGSIRAEVAGTARAEDASDGKGDG